MTKDLCTDIPTSWRPLSILNLFRSKSYSKVHSKIDFQMATMCICRLTHVQYSLQWDKSKQGRIETASSLRVSYTWHTVLFGKGIFSFHFSQTSCICRTTANIKRRDCGRLLAHHLAGRCPLSSVKLPLQPDFTISTFRCQNINWSCFTYSILIYKTIYINSSPIKIDELLWIWRSGREGRSHFRIFHGLLEGAVDSRVF